MIVYMSRHHFGFVQPKNFIIKRGNILGQNIGADRNNIDSPRHSGRGASRVAISPKCDSVAGARSQASICALDSIEAATHPRAGARYAS